MNKWCRRLLLAVGLVFLAGGADLQAQVERWGQGGIEITAFGGWFEPGNPDFTAQPPPSFANQVTYDISGALTYGGRLAYSFKNGFFIEGDFAYAKPDIVNNTNFVEEDVTRLLYGGVLGFSFKPATAFDLFITAGYGAIQWKWDDLSPLWVGDSISLSSETDNSFEWGLGTRLWISRNVAIRAEFRDYIAFDATSDLRRQLNNPPTQPAPGIGPIPDQTKNNWEFTGGLSLFFGGPKDADGDGVPDSRDRCPNTPRGVTVDADGCPIDSDGDGVPDYMDQCPNTPAGARVDANGCPVDSDGDGVPDGLDRCPNTPAGATVDANGCPSDSDGDGVYDGIDQCPNTPRGAVVDARGCPIDSDGDGVPDGLDQCPNTPAGVEVDAEGCSRIQAGIQAGRLVLQNIYFAFNSAELNPDSYGVLDELGNTLVARPEIRMEIQGHTDSVGSAAYNEQLSGRRAQSVLDYLLENFPQLSADRFRVRGVGEASPIATNDTDEGRALNRRVEFLVIGQGD